MSRRRKRRSSKMIRAAQGKLDGKGAVTEQQLEQVVAAARAQQQAGEQLEEILKRVMPTELQEKNPEMLPLLAGILSLDPRRMGKGVAMLAERTAAEGHLLRTAREAGARIEPRASTKQGDKHE